MLEPILLHPGTVYLGTPGTFETLGTLGPLGTLGCPAQPPGPATPARNATVALEGSLDQQTRKIVFWVKAMLLQGTPQLPRRAWSQNRTRGAQGVHGCTWGAISASNGTPWCAPISPCGAGAVEDTGLINLMWGLGWTHGYKAREKNGKRERETRSDGEHARRNFFFVQNIRPFNHALHGRCCKVCSVAELLGHGKQVTQ